MTKITRKNRNFEFRKFIYIFYAGATRSLRTDNCMCLSTTTACPSAAGTPWWSYYYSFSALVMGEFNRKKQKPSRNIMVVVLLCFLLWCCGRFPKKKITIHFCKIFYIPSLKKCCFLRLKKMLFWKIAAQTCLEVEHGEEELAQIFYPFA